jgi:hypothetical protein
LLQGISFLIMLLPLDAIATGDVWILGSLFRCLYRPVNENLS